jgi:galactose oxidase
MAFTTSRRSMLMLFMTPGLALLYGDRVRASAKNIISDAPGIDRTGNFPWARQGRWSQLLELPNVAIHTHVLPNGKVLFWGRRDEPRGSLDAHACTPYVWDPITGESRATPQPQRADGTKVNLFCSGHSFLPDGRPLVVGGHLTDGDGLDQACVYDYHNNMWTALPAMHQCRWYPVVTTLADGAVLVSSGSYKQNGSVVINRIPEIWDGRRWQQATRFADLPPYPRLYRAPSGQVLASESNAKMYVFNAGEGACTALPRPRGMPTDGVRQYGPSVTYDVGKVLFIGGSDDEANDVPTATSGVIDFCANPPAWRQIASMHFPRRRHSATILADGSVLVTGGTSGPGFNNLSPGRPVHVAESWDPVTEKWSKLAAEDVDRCYHSTAVLLPDATVLSAGGGEFVVGGESNDPRDSHRTAQIFHPPYLFRGPRPQIEAAPEAINYGESFSLEVRGPDVAKITWIGLPSVTHAADHSQRINILDFRRSSGGVTVTAPGRPEICPPGHYMLFVLSAAGVPSVARIMHIGHTRTSGDT